MKINGKAQKGPYIKTIVLPRGEENMVFKVQAILDYKEFNDLCPMPEPAIIVKRDGTKVRDVTDTEYQAKVAVYAEKRTHYLILKALEATDGLEWETVDMADSDTWKNYTEELKAAGITDAEGAYLIDSIIEVNGLDDKKLKQAAEDFLSKAAPVQDA